MPRSLDGLVLAPVADQAPGQVGTRTRFTYHEKDGEIWAEYAGDGADQDHRPLYGADCAPSRTRHPGNAQRGTLAG